MSLQLMIRFFCVLILQPMIVLGQNETAATKERKLILVGGIGFPDEIHIGLNYSISNRTTIGASIGSGVVNGEVAFQFGKNSLYVDRPVFYWSQRLNYYHDGNKAVLFASALGKNFYIEKNFGMNMDIGLAKQLYYQDDKSRCAPECDGQGLRGILPSARFQFFIKFK